eukprot:bmy_12495T0
MPVAVMAESSFSFRKLLDQCENQELEVTIRLVGSRVASGRAGLQGNGAWGPAGLGAGPLRARALGVWGPGRRGLLRRRSIQAWPPPTRSELSVVCLQLVSPKTLCIFAPNILYASRIKLNLFPPHCGGRWRMWILLKTFVQASHRPRRCDHCDLLLIRKALLKSPVITEAYRLFSFGQAPGGIATPPVYGQLLALYLLYNDMNNARYLWKRIPPAIKSKSVLNSCSSDFLRHFVEVSLHAINNWVSLGILEQGWQADSTTRMVMPKKPVAGALDVSFNRFIPFSEPAPVPPIPNEQQLARLTDYVAFLEN